MIKQCFSFEHTNYARYLTYQHVLLWTMENEKHHAIDELKSRGFGCNLSNGKFSVTMVI